MDPKDIIVAEISNAVTQVVGKSAGAVFRRAGSSASQKLWPDLPSNLSAMEAGEVIRKGIKALGGFGDFSIVSEENGVANIEFKGCVFADYTSTTGVPVGEQVICYFGFGLVEETFRRLTGKQVKIELQKRDDGCGKCYETATPR